MAKRLKIIGIKRNLNQKGTYIPPKTPADKLTNHDGRKVVSGLDIGLRANK